MERAATEGVRLSDSPLNPTTLHFRALAIANAIQDNPAPLRELEPANGWGTLENLEQVCTEILKVTQQHFENLDQLNVWASV